MEPEVIAGENDDADEAIDTTGGTDETTPVSAEEGKPEAAQEDGKPKDLSEAVLSALTGQKPEQASGSKEKSEKGDSAESDKADKDGEPSGKVSDEDLSDDDLQRLNAKTKKRIKQLLGRAESLGADIERLKPAAESFERIQSFVKKAGLDYEEVNTGFEIMALMKNDPDAAYEKLKPIFITLANMVGAGALPQDLTEKVRTGQMTEEDARELARHRARTGLTQRRVATQRQTEATAQQEQAREAQIKQTLDVITAWETQWKSTDADYAKKSERVKDKMALALTARAQTGKPVTAAEAKSFMDGILKQVNEEIKALLPQQRPQGLRPNPSSNSGRQPVAPAPKSMLDAVKAGLLKTA